MTRRKPDIAKMKQLLSRHDNRCGKAYAAQSKAASHIINFCGVLVYTMQTATTKPKILVTGGCGYIGSHTIVDLLDNGFDVFSIDNNLRSKQITVDRIEGITGKKDTNYGLTFAISRILSR